MITRSVVDNIDALVERAENRQNKEGKGHKGKGNPPMIENKTIVVDDDPKIATLLQTYLEECGFGAHSIERSVVHRFFVYGDKGRCGCTRCDDAGAGRLPCGKFEGLPGTVVMLTAEEIIPIG